MLREPIWDIHVDDDGHTLAVRPSGELDLSTSPELVQAFGDADGQREPERFALSGASEPVERLLEMTGVAGWFRRTPV